MRSVAARPSLVLLLALVLAPAPLALAEDAPDEYVDIFDDAFYPAVMGVDNGMVLRWKNFGSTFHEVHCYSPQSCAYQSPVLDRLHNYTVTVQGVGTQMYACRLHFFSGKLYVGTNLNSTQDLFLDPATFWTSRPYLAGGVPDPVNARSRAVVSNLGENASVSAQVELRDGENNVLGSTTIPSLASGESVTVSITWRAHPLWEGRVKMLVDPHNRIIEGHEGNNVGNVVEDLSILPTNGLP